MAKENTQNINDWIAQRETEIAQERNTNSKFVKISIGENKLEILKIPATKKIVDENGVALKFGARWHYTVKTPEGQEKILSASVVLDRMLVECMKEGIFNITLIKVGEGKNTRYSIKELA